MSDEAIIVEAKDRDALGDGRVRLSCDVRVDALDRATVWVHVPADAAPVNDDWMVPLIVNRAMLLARPVRFVGRVTGKVLEGAAGVQRAWSAWSKEFVPRELRADEVVAPPVEKPRLVASFFSGGLDSWYSALANQETIDDIVHIAGIDTKPDDRKRRARIEPAVQAAGDALGKPVLFAETNVREYFRRWKMWSEYYLGAGLAACALALGGRYRRVLVGAPHNERCQRLMRGSCLASDPLWSSETTQIVHEGVVTRVAKAKLVATSEAAMRGLRMCTRKDIDVFNCGKCEKCVRTMVTLHLIGALERCRTITTPLNLDDVAAVRHTGWSTRAYVIENLEEALLTNADPRLIKALCESMGADLIGKGAPGAPGAGAPLPTPPVARRTFASRIAREIGRWRRRVGSIFGRGAGGAGAESKHG